MHYFPIVDFMKLSLYKFSNKYFSKIGNPSSSSGFTLIELLAAISLTTIVVGAAGFGVVTIMNANAESETKTQRRVELNRALDFIAEDIRRAKTATDDPTTLTTDWSWDSNLGAVSANPKPKLYLEIPLSVEEMSAGSNLIKVPNHSFSNGNAVMFTGDGSIPPPLSKDTVYYIEDADQGAGTFKVSSTQGGSAVNLANDSSGNLTANQLAIYYIRDDTKAWLEPKTINRSVGPCFPGYATSNCPALVDSIAEDGFTTSVANEKRVGLNLTGKLEDDLYEVNTKAFARSANP